MLRFVLLFRLDEAAKMIHSGSGYFTPALDDWDAKSIFYARQHRFRLRGHHLVFVLVPVSVVVYNNELYSVRHQISRFRAPL